MSKHNKWDAILAIALILSTIWTISYFRVRANVIYDRFIFDTTTEADGELFVWENASPDLQFWLGVLYFFNAFAFAIIIGVVTLLVARLYFKAGWFKGRR